MKLLTFTDQGRTIIGALNGDSVVELSAVAADMLGLIARGQQGLAEARQTVATAADPILLAESSLRAPIPEPRRNVICLGLNYAEHAEESYRARGESGRPPDNPIFFTKATTAVNAPFGDIPFDPAISAQIDWEAELAVIIGRRGVNIAPAEAMDHVFGYTCLNDVSARDLQYGHKQFFKGKSLDGACPMGPWIVTSDEIDDPHSLAISCRVNGVTKQASNTGLMLFSIPQIIAILSRGLTLLPGDIIATGTPKGVGFARTPPEFLRPGDVVEVEIERIGLIRNRVWAGGPNRQPES
jgi:2-keto-4-pentenoate hydratase/2-oxohepta-3-ene-1,7-dioic acid hydratase in catechol pathway